VSSSFFSCTPQSFLAVSTLVVTVLELLSLLALHQFGFTLNAIPSGPVGLAFSLVYQFFRLVPTTYHFRVLGVAFSNKVFLFVLASLVNNPPNLKRDHNLTFVSFLRSACPQSALVHHTRCDVGVFRWRPISIRHCQSQKLPASSVVCPAELPLLALTHR